MVLSGTLREFIIADVFQLLARQKITGKLVLSSGSNEAAIYFRKGFVTCAERQDERLTDKLYLYLIQSCNIQEERVKAVFGSFVGNIQELTREIVDKGLIQQQALQSFCEETVEDITSVSSYGNQGVTGSIHSGPLIRWYPLKLQLLPKIL